MSEQYQVLKICNKHNSALSNNGNDAVKSIAVYF